MRVLICPDRMGALSSAAAGRAIAVGWPGAVIRPVGEAGEGFVEAAADNWGSGLHTSVIDGSLVETAIRGDVVAIGVSGSGDRSEPGSAIPYGASSLVLGRALASVLRERRLRHVFVDLAGLDVHDAGAGLLAALGATASGAELTGGVAELTGLVEVDLAGVRERLDGVDLVGILPSTQRDDHLLGLRGITSRRGRAAAEDAAVLLRTDDAIQRLTDLVDPESASVAGAGACGGLGWAVLALGGRLASGPEIGLADVGTGFDLVVTGCGIFDFATRGGGVVAASADLAGRCLAPCIVIADEVLIGAREMRSLGIEAAYPIRESSLDRPTGNDLSQAELIATVTRVSRSWRW